VNLVAECIHAENLSVEDWRGRVGEYVVRRVVKTGKAEAQGKSIEGKLKDASAHS